MGKKQKSGASARKRSQLITRIATPYFILVSIVLLIAMAISYTFFISNAKVNARDDAAFVGNSIAERFNDYVNELGFIANQVNRQPRVTGSFYELRGSDRTVNEFDVDVLKSIDISSALYGLIRYRANDYNVCVYNAYGDFISSETYMIDRIAVASELAVMDFESEIESIAESGGLLVSGPEPNRWTRSDTEYVTVRIALKNDLASDAVAIIEVRGNADRIDVAPYAGEIDGSVVELRHRITGRTLYTTAGEGRSVDGLESVSVPLEGTEWEIAVYYPDPVNTGYILRILAVFILILLVMTGFFFFVTYTIGRSVTRPIMKLAHRARSINAPNEQLGVVDDSALDEIRDLEESFDKMLLRVNQSADQEKKAYSLALQAQMNPHFLYNTLSIISAAGEEAGAENVTDMCVKLSDMLRYVASYEKITVPLKEEIAHTANYLSLMKSRYEDYFNYSILVDEELNNLAVPKLLVQPLAENCFKHGFKMSPPPWNIDVKIRGNNRHWELTIRDNGVGITDERIAEIRDKIDAAVSEMSLSDIGGVGLVNTVVRLKLTHSKRVDYSIRSGSGTTIRITVDRE